VNSKRMIVAVALFCAVGVFYTIFGMNVPGNSPNAHVKSGAAPNQTVVVSQERDDVSQLEASSERSITGVAVEKSIVHKPNNLAEKSKDTASNETSTFSPIDNTPVLNPFALASKKPGAIGDSDSVIASTAKRPKPPSHAEPQTNLTDSFIDAALNEDLDESLNVVSIEYTFSALPGNRYVPIPASIAALDNIYTHITATEKCTRCIFKWRHIESGEIEKMAVATLSPHTPRTIYLTPERGWKKGQYTMTVYDANESNKVLGHSSLLILSAQAQPVTNEADNELIQSLLSTGSAVPKIQ